MRIVPLLAYVALTSIALAAAPPKPTLLDLAKTKFAPRRLTAAEQELFKSTEKGEPASALTGDDKQDNPDNAHTWPDDRIIHAECLAWLCTDSEASRHVTYRGIQIDGMRIDGKLDLEFAQMSFPFRTWECAFTDEIMLRHAHFAALYLLFTHVKSIDAAGVKIDGSVFLRKGFKSEGEVNVNEATIGGDLDCEGAQLSNPNGNALVAQGAKIEGHVFLREGFKSEGEVNVNGATIGRDLDCEGAQLSNPNGNALVAQGVKIEGHVFLNNGFKAYGTADFTSSEVKGYFVWCKNTGAENSRFDFRSAKVGTLRDGGPSWPGKGKLFLDGFIYDRIEADTEADVPTDAKRRVDWLHRQPDDKFLPQSYEQLASVLRNMGYERDARRVMIQKNQDHGNFTKRFSQEWWWYNVFGWLIGYGYAPSRAFFISLGMIALGCLLFRLGYVHNIISPTDEKGYAKDAVGRILPKNGRQTFSEEYPKFNAFVYSLESFTPLLKLDQSSNWSPNANRGASVHLWRLHFTTGSLLRAYLWFHVMAGWVLTSLWVGGITGLVKS